MTDPSWFFAIASQRPAPPRVTTQDENKEKQTAADEGKSTRTDTGLECRELQSARVDTFTNESQSPACGPSNEALLNCAASSSACSFVILEGPRKQMVRTLPEWLMPSSWPCLKNCESGVEREPSEQSCTRNTYAHE